VANLGIRKPNGQSVKLVSNSNAANGRDERIIVAKVRDEELGGIMAVSYDNKKKKREKNK